MRNIGGGSMSLLKGGVMEIKEALESHSTM